MAIDQRDVASTLRFMDDRALQQYAAMHKNDPYIFPLAFQESQNRQRLRMSRQARMAQQPQPRVTEQALAAMLPEAQGIGALPAGNMEGMADGGIVGYEGYDESGVANTFGQGPVMMMAEGGHVPRYQGNPRDGSLVRLPYGGDTMGGFGGLSPEQEAAYEIRAENEQKLRQLSELEKQATFLESAGAPQAQQVRAQANALKSTMGPKPSPTDPSFRRQEDPRMRPGVAATAQPLITSDAAPKVDTGRKDTGRKTTAATEPTAKTDTGGLDALLKDFTRQTDLAQGALRNQRVGLASELLRSAEQDKAEGEQRRKERGDVFAGREARLAAREKGLEGMGDKYMGLALLQAGAAMMSTPGNLGTVLGKGIAVGSERYIAGIDKINAAKDKFAEARDRLEDLRLNRDDMNEKEIRDENRAIRNAQLQGKQLFLDGATNDLKVTNENLKTVLGIAAERENVLTRERGANARSAAQIRATLSTPDKVMFDQAMAKYGNDAFKAFDAVQQAKGEKFNLRSSYADYIKAFAGKDGLTPPMSIEQYAGKMGALLPR